MFNNVSKLIREAREREGLSQKEVATRLGYTSSQFISNIERGLCGIPEQQARKFCDILRIAFTTTYIDAVIKDTRSRYVRLVA